MSTVAEPDRFLSNNTFAARRCGAAREKRLARPDLAAATVRQDSRGERLWRMLERVG